GQRQWRRRWQRGRGCAGLALDGLWHLPGRLRRRCASGDNKLNDRDREGGRLQFLYTPNDDLSLRLIADYSQIDEVCCAAVTVRNNYQVFSRNSVTGAYSATPGPGTDSIFSIPRSVLIPGLPVPVAGFGATIVDESRVFDDVVAF